MPTNVGDRLKQVVALAHAGINTLFGVLLGITATMQTMAHYSHFLDGPRGNTGVLLMAAAGGLPRLDPLVGGGAPQAHPADG